MLCNSPYHSSVFFFLSPRKSRKTESFFAGEMCEPEEDNSCPFPPRQQHHHHQQQQQLMDLDDLDLASSWPFDQLTFGSSDPTSPLIIPSSTDQPYSPLWTFSEDEKLTAAAGHNICLTCAATNSATENPKDDDDDNNRKLSSPFLEMMPMENQDGYCVIKERMTQALRYFKESTEQQVLAQVWVPVKNRGRYVLTTLGQPFVLDPHSNGLHEYRTVSLMYTFSVDGESDVDLGLPGRVFRQKLPEWTPNVQYYSSKEYSRLDHALLYNVRGTLALPVFEPSGPSCVAVIELILTSQKINYAPEVDKVCKALEAVNLKSSKILDHPNTQICNESRQHALAEILEILTVVCETHKLPLAQTWIPCRHRSVLAHGGGLKKSCSSFDGSCVGQVCMSTTDVAFYVVDAHMWGFREACAEHHLQKGQGVAGKAFLSRDSCFCADITQFCKTEYPLVHYARMFGLTGCFAICLQSRHTGDDEYVLEFFLPPIITNHDEQKVLLGEILATMKQHYGSLNVASGVEANEGSIEIIQASADDRIDPRLESHPVPTSLKSAPGSNASLNGQAAVDLDLVKEVDVPDASGSQNPVCLPENKEIKKPSERKRGKTEKSISLEVLQQYFSGSLKDAAKSLGVCPTTMKRICRQHGISRWPSRKINKVNRSLNKLKRVIESVHGTEGAFGLPSLGTSSLPVAVGSIAWQSNLNGSHQQTSPTSKHSDPQGDKNGSSPHQMPGSKQALVENQSPEGRTSSQEELSPHQNGFSQAKGSNSSRTGSGSREGSAGTPTSRVSRHDSPAAESASTKDPPGSSINPQFFNTGSSSHLAFHHHHHPTGEEPILSSPFSIPDSFWRIDGNSQDAFSAMLVEDAGSSKDLRNLCPTAADAMDAMAVFTQTTPRATSSPETRSLTIKATYREDIIRFRISSNCGIVDLKEEVAKRLKLEVGTFDIKYLDDDNEWVLIACDADLLECLDISGSSGCSIIRLAIHDTMANLGSSCESTGAL